MMGEKKGKQVHRMTVYDVYDDVIAAFREKQSRSKDEAQQVLRQVGILDDHNQIMPAYKGIIIASRKSDGNRNEDKR